MLKHRDTLKDSDLVVLRCFIVMSLIVCISALQHGVNPGKNPDLDELNSALHSKPSIMIFASIASFPLAVVIETALDMMFYPGVDRYAFELLLFAGSTVFGGAFMLLTLCVDDVTQLFVTCEACRRLVMMTFLTISLNATCPDILTRRKAYYFCFLFAAAACIRAYFMNSTQGELSNTMEVFLIVLSVILFSSCAVVTGRMLARVYMNAARSAAEETFAKAALARSSIRMTFMESWQYVTSIRLRHLSRDDLLTLLYIVPASTLMPVSAVRSAKMAESGAKDLLTGLTLQCVLVLLLILLPSRLVRFDVMKVQQALEAKKRLARHVYHEMRTPLNIVVMGLELLFRSNKILSAANAKSCTPRWASKAVTNTGRTGGSCAPDPEKLLDEQIAACEAEATDLIDSLQLSCSTTIEILNDMLVYDKLGGSMHSLQLVCCSVMPFIRQIVHPFLVHAKQRGVTIKIIDRVGNSYSTFTPHINCGSAASDNGVTVSDEPPCEPYVLIDPVKMGQVLRNFLSNSLKFTPKGGCVTVMVSVVRDPCKPKPGGDKQLLRSEFVTRSWHAGGRAKALGQDPLRPRVRFSVIDTGIGLSADTMGKLFHETVQYKPNLLQGGGGSGFGLKITKSIMDLHQGTVGASSNGVGKGATFFADLPVYFEMVTSEEQRDGGLIMAEGCADDERPREASNVIPVLPSNSDPRNGRVTRPTKFRRSEKVYDASGSNAMLDSPPGHSKSRRSEHTNSMTGTFWSANMSVDISTNSFSSVLGDSFVGSGIGAGMSMLKDLVDRLKEPTMPSQVIVLPPLPRDGESSWRTLIQSPYVFLADHIASADNATPTGPITTLRALLADRCLRVLLVMRSSMCRRMVHRLLTALNPRVELDEVDSGQACINILRRRVSEQVESNVSLSNANVTIPDFYDLIIMDFYLDGLTGPQTATAIRKSQSSTPSNTTDEDCGVGQSSFSATSRRASVNQLSSHDDGVVTPPLNKQQLFGGLLVGLSGMAGEDDLRAFVKEGADAAVAKPIDVNLFESVLVRGLLVKGIATRSVRGTPRAVP